MKRTKKKNKIVCLVDGCKEPHIDVLISPIGDYESEWNHPPLDHKNYHYVHYSLGEAYLEGLRKKRNGSIT